MSQQCQLKFVRSDDTPRLFGEPCPKCGTSLRDEQRACSKCGLERNHFGSFRSAEQPSTAMQEAWLEVERSWNDPAAHRTFVEHAAATGNFLSAASKYRAASIARPGDEIATQQLERINKMVMALLAVESMKRERPRQARSPFRGVLLVLAVLGLAGGGGMVALQGPIGGPAATDQQATLPRTSQVRIGGGVSPTRASRKSIRVLSRKTPSTELALEGTP